jgi:hypothetical protein
MRVEYDIITFGTALIYMHNMHRIYPGPLPKPHVLDLAYF